MRRKLRSVSPTPWFAPQGPFDPPKPTTWQGRVLTGSTIFFLVVGAPAMVALRHHSDFRVLLLSLIGIECCLLSLVRYKTPHHPLEGKRPMLEWPWRAER